MLKPLLTGSLMVDASVMQWADSRSVQVGGAK